MKSRPKVAQYVEGPEAAERFQRGLADVLQISKEELLRREAEHEERARHKARRGPKPGTARIRNG